MLPIRRRAASLLPGLLLLTLPVTARAQAADPDPGRFAEAIERFERWDRQNVFPERSVLFVGSSSIVGWATAERFAGLPVINRGFGGSHISDVNHYVEQTVLKYAPEVVVLYAGNNDVNAGKTPQQVFEDYRAFVAAVHGRKDDTRIVYIAIHPSTLRWASWPQMKEVNDLIRAYAGEDPRLRYVDVATPMLGPDGQPMRHLLVEDGLHLTEAGYDVWTPLVAREIQSARQPGVSRR